MTKKSKTFRVKVRGTFVDSKEFIFLKRNGMIVEYFRKKDARSSINRLMRSMRDLNRHVPLSQRKTLQTRIVKV